MTERSDQEMDELAATSLKDAIKTTVRNARWLVEHSDLLTADERSVAVRPGRALGLELKKLIGSEADFAKAPCGIDLAPALFRVWVLMGCEPKNLAIATQIAFELLRRSGLSHDEIAEMLANR